MSDDGRGYTDEELEEFLRFVEYDHDPVEAYVSERFNKALPESGLVYHYASIAGFSGILESGVLWASPVSKLNDRREIHDGAYTIKRVLEKVGQGALPGVEDPVGVWRHLAAGYFNTRWEAPESYDIFTVSFCENPDLASQWGMYGGSAGNPPGSGFAIGLPVGHLYRARPYHRYQFGACTYEVGAKESIISGALDTCAKWVDYLTRCGLNHCAAMEWAEQKFYYSLLPRLPLFKHPSFISEQEWRVALWKLEEQPFPIEVEDVRGEEREVLKFSLWSQEKLFSGYSYLPIFDVVAGPGISDEIFNEARRQLDDAGYGKVQLRRSDCPLR